jgi:hypothetical protein
VAAAAVPWQTTRNNNPIKGFFRTVKRIVQNKCEMLFMIERDLNRNVVIYGLNKNDEGVVQLPTVAFWLMIPDSTTRVHESHDTATDSDSADEENCSVPPDLHTEDLTFIEKNLAYGIAQNTVNTAEEVIYIKALENQPIYVRRDGQGRFYATVDINGTSMCLRRIFICTDSNATILRGTKEVHVEVSETLDSHASITYYYRV